MVVVVEGALVVHWWCTGIEVVIVVVIVVDIVGGCSGWLEWVVRVGGGYKKWGFKWLANGGFEFQQSHPSYLGCVR